MRTKQLFTVALAILIGISTIGTPTLAAEKPHASPAAPALGDPGDWREEYAYTLGLQAAVFTYPWLYFAHLRYGWIAKEKPAGYKGIDMPLNQFYHFRNTVDASYRAGGSPNNDTLYSLVFLDVGKEPVILSHPDMGDRYFTFEIASMKSDNFAYVGPGLDVGKVDDAIKRGLIRAIKTAGPMIKAAGQSAGFGKVINGWSISPNTMGSAGYSGDFLSRGAIQSGAGIVANDPEEAVYPLTRIDASGDVLDGAEKYTMTFAPGNLPKVDAFWSLTLCDNTFNLVDNPIDRYNITSQTGGYKKAKDGSLTLYIQNETPGKDKESNWLPSPKSGSFFMVFRTYMPSKEIVGQTWQIPGLVKVK